MSGKGRNVVNLNPRGPRGRSNQLRLAGWVVLGIVGLYFASTSIFTVDPEEEAVVLRFGRFAREVEPGLHFKLPDPIESYQKVPIQRQLKEEFGFRTESAGVRTEYSSREYDEESLMLTGDLNVGDVEWIAQYRIKDPYKFLFKVRDVRQTFRDLNEAVMREIVGDRSVTEVLTVGRSEIEATAQQMLQALCDEYETGIQVEQVVLQNVNPPGPVKPSFDEVNQAQQERERMVNDARAEYNRVIPAARGEAQQLLAQAEGYATERVNRAEGEAARFDALRVAYEAAPEVTRKRLYLETMAEIYPKAKTKIVMDDDARSVLPLLDLARGGER